MKISLDWISDYVDLADITPEDLADKLTLATAEIEGVEYVTNAGDSVVVARVAQLEPLSGPDGATWLVTLDVGQDRAVSTVSTAPNLHVGMLSVYAPPGAKLPGGTVGVQTISGRESRGMLCSAAEIGFGEFHEVVLECPADVPVGTRLDTVLPGRDVLFDIDNKSLTHRPDLWGHYGFAREVAAVLRRKLRPLNLVDLARWDHLDPHPVINEDECLCPVFTCMAVDVTENRPSPLRIQARLHTLGLRSLGSFVDATNYVALELGQPTHIYDRGLVGPLRVARMGRKAPFQTLDGRTRDMEPDDLMIWSQNGPVGIAGIMGGLDSSVRPGTTQLLLESANFTAPGIRRTGIRLNLRTDASQRYEKTQPPQNAKVGLARLLALLGDAGVEPRPVSGASVAGETSPDIRTVVLPADHVQRVAGAPIEQTQVEEILHALGFATSYEDTTLTVTVPPFRSAQDISIPADIVEEVLRVYGYGSIPQALPEAHLTPTPTHRGFRRAHKARAVMAQSHGFTEVENYLWFDDSWLGQLSWQPDAALRLRNPVAPEKARLRTTLLPSLLKVASENLAHAEEFAIFEIGHVFLPVTGTRPVRRSSDPTGHSEEQRLAAVSITPTKGVSLEEHYLRVKGALEDLGRAILGAPLTTSAGHAEGHRPWELPDLWADVLLADEVIGTIGVLDKPILDTVAPNRQAVWFEIDLEVLGGSLFPEAEYEPLPAVPGSQQDFSFLWPLSRSFAGLEKLLEGFSHPLVQRREFISLYRGKGLEPGIGSYLFRYWLQDPERTLTSEDLTGFRSELLAHLDSHGVSLR